MKRARLALAALVGLAAVSGIVALAVQPGKDTSSITARRSPAPALPGEVLVRPRVTLASLHGRPAVINFWASWCGPCQDEAPGLEQLAVSLQGRVTLVGVDWNDAVDGAREFIASYRWTFPVLRDSDGVVGDDFGVRGLPATFLLDANGRIAVTLFGPQTAAGIRDALQQNGLLR